MEYKKLSKFLLNTIYDHCSSLIVMKLKKMLVVALLKQKRKEKFPQHPLVMVCIKHLINNGKYNKFEIIIS